MQAGWLGAFAKQSVSRNCRYASFERRLRLPAPVARVSGLRIRSLSNSSRLPGKDRVAFRAADVSANLWQPFRRLAGGPFPLDYGLPALGSPLRGGAPPADAHSRAFGRAAC